MCRRTESFIPCAFAWRARITASEAKIGLQTLVFGSDVELLKAYPSLNLQNLAQAWAYADAHADEIGRLIREKESPEAE